MAIPGERHKIIRKYQQQNCPDHVFIVLARPLKLLQQRKLRLQLQPGGHLFLPSLWHDFGKQTFFKKYTLRGLVLYQKLLYFVGINDCPYLNLY